MRSRLWRMAGAVLGWLLVAVGLVLYPLPGPGLLVLAAGLWLVAVCDRRAKRWLDPLRLRAIRETARGVLTWPRTLSTSALTLLLAASGLLWLWDPPEPRWWVLPTWTWLPGGLWAGVGQLVSGVVALAIVAAVHRRFHGRPQAWSSLTEQIAHADRLRAAGAPETAD